MNNKLKMIFIKNCIYIYEHSIGILYSFSILFLQSILLTILITQYVIFFYTYEVYAKGPKHPKDKSEEIRNKVNKELSSIKETQDADKLKLFNLHRDQAFWATSRRQTERLQRNVYTVQLSPHYIELIRSEIQQLSLDRGESKETLRSVFHQNITEYMKKVLIKKAKLNSYLAWATRFELEVKEQNQVLPEIQQRSEIHLFLLQMLDRSTIGADWEGIGEDREYLQHMVEYCSHTLLLVEERTNDLKEEEENIRFAKQYYTEESSKIEQSEAELTELLQLLQNIDKTYSEEKDSDKEPPPPPPPGASGCVASFSLGEGTSCAFTPYDTQGNICSLYGLQGTLDGLSTQIATLLRTVLTKGMPSSRKNGYESTIPYAKVIHVGKRQGKRGEDCLFTNSVLPYSSGVDTRIALSVPSICASMHTQQMNLEEKVRSTHFLYTIMPVLGLHVGLGYRYSHTPCTTYPTGSVSGTFGSVTSRTKTKIFSAVVGWNSDGVGLTGQLAVCGGWGQSTLMRYATYTGKTFSTKGNPYTSLQGSLLRLGYGFQLRKDMVVSPYVEQLYTQTQWRSYTESTTCSELATTISQHKEQITESCFGLRFTWNRASCSWFNTWISGVLGQCTRNALTSSSVMHHSLYRTSMKIPSKKSTYVYSETGMSYEMNVSETCSVFFASTMQFKKKTKSIQNTIQCFVQKTF